MLAAFSDLFVWYQIPIFAILVLTSLSFKLLSKPVSKMGAFGRGSIFFGQLLLLFLLFFALVVPSLNRARNMAYRSVCKTRLKGLGIALEMYYKDKKAYPPSPKELIDGGYASDKNFQCPSDIVEQKVYYFYLPPLEADADETFVMCDMRGYHKNKRNVLAKAGHVAEYSEEEFQAELAQPYNTRFAAALKKAEGP